MSVPKTVSVTTSAILLAASNDARVKLDIQNTHASVHIFLGQDANVTAANGFRLKADTPYGDDQRTTENDPYYYSGAVWAIAASSTVDVRVWEKERLRD